MRNIVGQARKMRSEMESVASTFDDETAIDRVSWFPKWNPGSVEYAKDERVSYNDELYRCIQPHTSQVSWAPDVAISLWVRVDNPEEEWPEWKLPTGSTDAYAKGKKVSHNGKHWISDYENNVWEPGVFGWSEVE